MLLTKSIFFVDFEPRYVMISYVNIGGKYFSQDSQYGGMWDYQIIHYSGNKRFEFSGKYILMNYKIKNEILKNFYLRGRKQGISTRNKNLYYNLNNKTVINKETFH